MAKAEHRGYHFHIFRIQRLGLKLREHAATIVTARMSVWKIGSKTGLLETRLFVSTISRKEYDIERLSIILRS